jgi:hypothetical protein
LAPEVLVAMFQKMAKQIIVAKVEPVLDPVAAALDITEGFIRLPALEQMESLLLNM